VAESEMRANVAVKCPICNAIVHVQNEPIDEAISRHIDRGCATGTSTSTSSASSHTVATLYKCNYARCIERELTRVVCNECGLQTCLRHRAPTAHACVARAERAHDASVRAAAASAREVRHESVLERIRSLVAGGSASDSPAAASVRRIQHRQRATGDKRVPADERAYFEVVFPFESGVEPRAMFFSNKASVGRVLDDVASAGGISNNNNKPDAPKLYLISLRSGNPLANGATLGSLLAKGELHSGDSLLLEYLENTTSAAAATPAAPSAAQESKE
jgi:hypothetical protein